MAKGNLFMGMARGSIGDITFWRGDNEQLSRARNRKPSNPRTDRQLQSRIILKTVSSAYSLLMGDLANQTFQGAANARENQRRFLSANARLLRQLVDDGTIADANFMGRDDTTALLNRYVLSEGGLNTQVYSLNNTSPLSSVVSFDTLLNVGERDITYQDVCDCFGLPAGSQLTFVLVRNTGGVINFVQRQRLILAPASGDMTANFLAVGGGINDPNPENDMGTGVVVYNGTAQKIEVSFFGNFGACAVIASKLDGSVWKYSKQQLWYSPTAGYGTHTLPDAIESWKTEEVGSDLYTRQANVPTMAAISSVTGYVESSGVEGGPVMAGFTLTSGSAAVNVPNEFNNIHVDVYGSNLRAEDVGTISVRHPGGQTSELSVESINVDGAHISFATSYLDIVSGAGTFNVTLSIAGVDYHLDITG